MAEDFKAFQDKMSLGQQSQFYLDNMVKYLQILYYSKMLDDERIHKVVTMKINPMFQSLADEMSKIIDEYQDRHGEI